MAISAAIGVGKKIVGKAINAAKKKKKDLETKGRRIKQKKVKDELTNAKFKSAIDPNKAAIDADKATRKIMKTPDIVAGVGASAAQTGKKAIKAAKPTIDKATTKVKNLSKKINKDDAAALAVGGTAAIGTYALTTSILKSRTLPEQEYNQNRLADGRFSTTFGGKNRNVIFSNKQLSEKQVDELRSELAILDSIIESSDPKKRKTEFTNIAMRINQKYGISNITGKNLSILMPGGIQYKDSTIFRENKKIG